MFVGCSLRQTPIKKVSLHTVPHLEICRRVIELLRVPEHSGTWRGTNHGYIEARRTRIIDCMPKDSKDFCAQPRLPQRRLRLDSPLSTAIERWTFLILKAATNCRDGTYWSIAQRSPCTSELDSGLSGPSSKSAYQEKAEAFTICRGRRSSRRYHPLKTLARDRWPVQPCSCRLS